MLRKKIKEKKEIEKTSPFVGHSANLSFDIKFSDSMLDVFDTDINFYTVGDTFKELNIPMSLTKIITTKGCRVS
jgi:hypothetical protein